MTEIDTKTRPVQKTKPERPKLWKVILLNDDYTPREFVVLVLSAVFGMGPEKAYHVMATAHQKGACVVAVFTKDVAETKAAQATDAGAASGFPLTFTTEKED
ncbi:ATP-dependent Clp protease adapter ClpS [Rhodobacteraceae bacterium NNCM2]|nr:ATP-dependent Clp protease adapter ClpS [Coraliihabitans acroporae]